MHFEFTDTGIKGIRLIHVRRFPDKRGFLEEQYKTSEFENQNTRPVFRQVNHSFSVRGTLRGLHFQKAPYGQDKLIYVVSGKILDVAVDLRTHSPTYGKHVSFELSDHNQKMLWVPAGFAHGFLAQVDSHVVYSLSNEYHKEAQCGVIWNDKELAIEWGIENPLLSDKDKGLPNFSSIRETKYFDYSE